MLKKRKLLLSFAALSTTTAASISAVGCSFSKVEVVGGKLVHTCEIGESGSDDSSWKLQKNGEAVSGVAYKIEKLSDWNDDGTISISKDGKISWTAFETKGTYRFCVVVASEDIEARSEPIVLDVVEPSGQQVVVEGGSPLIKQLVDDIPNDGYWDATPWELKIDDVAQENITWTLDGDGIDGIQILNTKPGGQGKWFVFVGKSTSLGTHSFKVIGTSADGEATANANVTVVISENKYTLSGGSASLTLYTGASGADETTWQLKKDGTAISADLSLSDSKPDWLSLNNGKLTWTKAQTITSSNKLYVIAKVGGVEKARTEITILVQDAIMSVEMGGYDSTTIQDVMNYWVNDITWNPLVPTELRNSITYTWHAYVNDVDQPTWVNSVEGHPDRMQLRAFSDGSISEVKVAVDISFANSNEDKPLFTATKQVALHKPTETVDNAIFIYDDLDESTDKFWWTPNPEYCDEDSIYFEQYGNSEIYVEVDRDDFDSPISFSTNSTNVDTTCINNCKNFNSSIEMPWYGYSIGDDFLEGYSSFNQELYLDNCISIGNSFMYGCQSFNNNKTEGTDPSLKIPSSVTTIGQDFMVNCYSLTGLDIKCSPSVFSTDSDMTLTVNDRECPAINGVNVSFDNFADFEYFETLFPEIYLDDIPDHGYYRVYAA